MKRRSRSPADLPLILDKQYLISLALDGGAGYVSRRWRASLSESEPSLSTDQQYLRLRIVSTDPADRVLCFDEKGQIVPVARAELSYAPAVYGILIEEGRALLLTLPLIPSEFNETEENAPRWRLIGGRIRPGDVPADGLARFFRRSTGFAPLLQQLVRVETRYVIEKGRPWALGGLFYRVTRPGGAVVTPQQDEHRPVWVPIQELTRASVPFGFSAIVSQQKREENS